jgi:hypothetical protein
MDTQNFLGWLENYINELDTEKIDFSIIGKSPYLDGCYDTQKAIFEKLKYAFEQYKRIGH